MIGLLYAEKTDDMLSCFHLIPERHRQICYINMLTRDKNATYFAL